MEERLHQLDGTVVSVHDGVFWVHGVLHFGPKDTFCYVRVEDGNGNTAATASFMPSNVNEITQHNAIVIKEGS